MSRIWTCNVEGRGVVLRERDTPAAPFSQGNASCVLFEKRCGALLMECAARLLSLQDLEKPL